MKKKKKILRIFQILQKLPSARMIEHLTKNILLILQIIEQSIIIISFDKMLLSFLLIKTTATLFVGFGTAFQPDSYIATKCTGYIGQNFCVGYNSSGAVSSTIIQYDTFEPNSSYFTNINGVNQLMTSSGMVSSYSNPLYFVSGNVNGGVYKVSATANTAQLIYQHNYSSYYNMLVVQDKGSIPKFYFFLVTSFSATNFSTQICYKIMPSSACTSIANLSTQVLSAKVTQYRTIVILHLDNAMNTTTLSLMYPNGTIYSNLTKNIKGTSNFLATSANYVGFAINGFIYAYNINTTSQIWTFTITIPKKVKQLTLLYPWLVTYDDNNKVIKFNIVNGLQYDSHAPTSIYQYCTITFNSATKVYNLRLHIFNDSLIYQSVMSDQYITENGTCIAGYTLSGVNCQAITPTTILSLFIFTPAPPPSINSTNSSQNSFNSSICFDPHIQDASQCQIFCSQRCNECISSRFQCSSCSQYYFLIDQNLRYCEMYQSMQIISLIYIVLNTFKNSKTLILYAYLQDFQLYQYHRIRYEGVLESVFNFTRFVQEKQWEIVQTNLVLDKFDAQWFTNSDYIPMTQIDYLLVERKDLTFLQNTKQFFCLLVPFVVVAFVLFNRLSKCFGTFSVKKIFTNFSFWIYLLIILVFNDTQRFSYLSFMQLANLFHFRFMYKVYQSLSVVVIGLWFILCCVLYIMCTYFHKKRTIDMGNFKCKHSSLFVITFLFAFKPITQSAIHYFLWSRTDLQIIFILLVKLVSFFICATAQMMKKIVKSKITFVVQSALDLLGAFINVLIYVKYIYLQKADILHDQSQIKAVQIMEQGIQVAIYISGVMLGLLLLIGLCETFKLLVCVQKKNNDIFPVKSEHQRAKNSKKDQKLALVNSQKKKKKTQQAQLNPKSKIQAKRVLIKVQKVNFRKQVEQFLIKTNCKKSKY